MKNKTDLDILSSLDPLKEREEPLDIPLSGVDEPLKRRIFYTPDLYIVTYHSDSKESIENLWDIYDTINNACPELIKSIRREKTVFVAYPRYEDKFNNATYSLMVDEIIRVTAYLLKANDFNRQKTAAEVKNYIKLCVSHGKD